MRKVPPVWDDLACRRPGSSGKEGTRRVKATGTRPKIVVSADGRGVVGHAGARLLADVAEVTGLTGACSYALARLRQRRGVHDPGRVVVDLAVMLADGGEGHFGSGRAA